MSMFGRKELAAHEADAVQALFTRIIDAEKDNLTDEQRSDPRAYLLSTWRTAAETVMRPLHRVEEMAEGLAKQRSTGGFLSEIGEY